MQKLKPITFKELAAWIKRNKHVTWDADSFGSGQSGKSGHLKGKYIRFSIDTRTMNIFRLELEGTGETIEIDFRDFGDGNLLDELDRVLSEDGK